MKKLLFTFTLGIFTGIFSSQTAIGLNWVKIEEDNKSILYIYLDSITKTKEGTIRYWEKKSEKNIKEATRAFYLLETDCEEKKERMLQITLFYEDVSTETFSTSSEWYYYIPDTFSEDRYKLICSELLNMWMSFEKHLKKGIIDKKELLDEIKRLSKE
jgi:hypothetical protein